MKCDLQNQKIFNSDFGKNNFQNYDFSHRIFIL